MQIELLPALPKSWPSGSVRGLCARGGFEVDIAWNNGALTGTMIRTKHGGICKIRYGGKTVQVATRPGRMLHFNGCLTSE